jgi:hypothetical protein
MPVIEAQRASIQGPHGHRHIRSEADVCRTPGQKPRSAPERLSSGLSVHQGQGSPWAAPALAEARDIPRPRSSACSASRRLPDGRLAVAVGQPMLLLLHTRGARSGQPRSTPLLYTRHGRGYVVVASKAGADHHPAWY